MTLYDEKSYEECIASMSVPSMGVDIMYFDVETGKFSVGEYNTGTVESDQFYQHNVEVCRSPTVSDLSTWLGCFECDGCEATQEKMDECFSSQIRDNFDEDVIRDAVEKFVKETLQDGMDTLMEIITQIYLKYYPTHEYHTWLFSTKEYHESTAWDLIIERLEDGNVEYKGKESLDETFFNGEIVWITEYLFPVEDSDYKEVASNVKAALDNYEFKKALGLLQ